MRGAREISRAVNRLSAEVGVRMSIVSQPVIVTVLVLSSAVALAEPFRLENLLQPSSRQVPSQNRATSGRVIQAQYEYSNGKPPLQFRPPTRSQATNGNSFSIQRPPEAYMTGGQGAAPTSQQAPTAQRSARPPQQQQVSSTTNVQHPLFSGQTSRSPARVIQRGTNAVRDMFRREPQQAPQQRVPDPTHLAFDSGPVSPDLHVSAARLMVQRGDIAAAFQHYQAALRMDPRCRHALIGLARLQHRGGDIAGAINTYRLALQRLGKDAVVYNDLGLCLARARKHDEATQMLRFALALNPKSKMYRNNLAATYVEAGRPIDAMRVLTEAYGETVAHYNVGYLLQQRGSLDEARTYFIRSLRTDPTFDPARQMLENVELRISNRPNERTPLRRDFSANQAGEGAPNLAIGEVGNGSTRLPKPTNDPPVTLASATEPIGSAVVTTDGEGMTRTGEPELLTSVLKRDATNLSATPLGLVPDSIPVISQPKVYQTSRPQTADDGLIAPLPPAID